jgi:hypothetical protein
MNMLHRYYFFRKIDETNDISLLIPHLINVYIVICNIVISTEY